MPAFIKKNTIVNPLDGAMIREFRCVSCYNIFTSPVLVLDHTELDVHIYYSSCPSCNQVAIYSEQVLTIKEDL